MVANEIGEYDDGVIRMTKCNQGSLRLHGQETRVFSTFQADPLKEKKPIDFEDVIVVSHETLPNVKLPRRDQVDPYSSMGQLQDFGQETPWKDLSHPRRLLKVTWIISRIILAIGFLYLFICSLDILSSAFQLLAGRTAGELFKNNDLLNNPVCGLIIGVLVTVLVQSSSTSTSIVVTMVGAGLLPVRPAVPIIMGANIGTSVTNTIVSITQSADKDTFRRAFAGATVHDMFNWMCVLILLPLELASRYLERMTEAIVQTVNTGGSTSNQEFIKVITKPLTNKIVEVDKKVINGIAENSERRKWPIVKFWCSEKSDSFSITNFYNGCGNETEADLLYYEDLKQNISAQSFTQKIKLETECLGQDTNNSITESPWMTRVHLSWTNVNRSNSKMCSHLFTGVGTEEGSPLTEPQAGGILLVCSLAAMIICLILMVKVLNSLLRGPMAKIIRRSINSDLPGRAAFLTGYIAMLIGAGVTILVQSSSVFTSAITPLVGMGLVSVERVYPLTLGSNIGTTFTSLLSALAADSSKIRYTLQISLCHLFFNITGIIIFYPIPLMRRAPIHMAKWLGDKTAKYPWFAVVYLLGMFFILPGIIFGLSIPGWYVLLGVGGPFLLILIFAIVINISHNRCRKRMVPKLQNWEWLPLWMHSCKPCDRACLACCDTLWCHAHCSKCARSRHKEQVTDSDIVAVPMGELSTSGKELDLSLQEILSAIDIQLPSYAEALADTPAIHPLQKISESHQNSMGEINAAFDKGE